MTTVMRLQRSDEDKACGPGLVDPEPVTLRSLMSRRRRPSAVRRTIGAGALALMVAVPAVACTSPAYGLDLGPDEGVPGRRAHLSGWLDEDEYGGRPDFWVTVDGRPIHKGRADGEQRMSGWPAKHHERKFETGSRSPPARTRCASTCPAGPTATWRPS